MDWSQESTHEPNLIRAFYLLLFIHRETSLTGLRNIPLFPPRLVPSLRLAGGRAGSEIWAGGGGEGREVSTATDADGVEYKAARRAYQSHPPFSLVELVLFAASTPRAGSVAPFFSFVARADADDLCVQSRVGYFVFANLS